MSTDVNTGLNLGMGGLRKASPEALALMMKNLKQNNANSKKAWIPNGATAKKDAKSKKIFFWKRYMYYGMSFVMSSKH